MKKIAATILVALLAAACVFTFAACNPPAPEGETFNVTDVLGRSVDVPVEVNRVVCIGAGALRLYSYVGDMSKLCGVEDVDKDGTGVGGNLSIRPYKMVNSELLNSLPSCGVGGPQNQSPEAEKILALNPDIIVSLYTQSKDAMDILQSQTGIPVVTLSYGDTEAFDQRVLSSITLLGKVLGRETRAREIVDYINGIVADLSGKTLGISYADKPSLYIGCQSNYGTHGIESSTADYSIFNVSHIKNILDVNGYSGYVRNIDLEALLSMNPDKIVIDAGGLSLLKNQYGETEKAAVFNAMKAFKTGEVYLQMPYNAYYTNLEIAYCDAYFDAWVSYPDLFPNGLDDVIAKSREIMIKFLGEDCYDEVAKYFPNSDNTEFGFRKLDLAATFPQYAK